MDLTHTAGEVAGLPSADETGHPGWDARDADSATTVVSLAADVLDELCDNRARLQQAIPPQGLEPDGAVFPALAREAIRLRRTHLDEGLGFVVLRGLDPDVFSPREMENVFWRLCAALGEPMVQKGEGVRFGRVADLGLPAEARPRYHETGAGGSVHTDSPILTHVADAVGLLCLRAAQAGGESRFVSVARVHDILDRHAAPLLAELYEPFHFDRRIAPSAVSPTNPAVLRAPIFTRDPVPDAPGPRGVRLRWQPEYVWQAADLAGVPALSERQRLALHLLEAVLEDRAGALTLRVAMAPGDMQFLNNHAVAHGRTAFRDDDPTTRREMRRVWLRYPS